MKYNVGDRVFFHVGGFGLVSCVVFKISPTKTGCVIYETEQGFVFLNGEGLFKNLKDCYERIKHLISIGYKTGLEEVEATYVILSNKFS